ncbi:outer membrane beta-barrel protein [Roseivirga sp. E12]|uniref:outer membrane beta-barrel protein n=1 Tax=Roseivirga sp. E12 TaxID=2819237 RepID=UPI001ABCABE7|nr:outer membrane beta-barrel protein [Roseivirga sp. E12]MBO3700776.1 PorT family protein [Roseivirga sp. E12]
MKKLLLGVVGLVFMSLSVQAQRPDLPGALLVDIGVNSWSSAPTDVSLNSFQSKTVNLTYYYDLPIGNNGFTFTPGIGLSLERYSLENNFTFTSSVDANSVRSVAATDINSLVSNPISFDKSKLALHYLDIPLELRYYKSKNQYNRGFRAALGIKAGVLYSTFTKYRYEDRGGDNRTVKDRQDLGFNRFRYGIQGRFGWGGLSFFGFYELSDKWDIAPAGGENTKTLTFGISLTGF